MAIEQPRVEPPRHDTQILKEREPRVVTVNRNQSVDEVIHQIQIRQIIFISLILHFIFYLFIYHINF